MSEPPLWQGRAISPEPPAHVTRIRDDYGDEAARGGLCDYCGGSLWVWTLVGGQRRTPAHGDDLDQVPLGYSVWECWADLDIVGPLQKVRP
ncbi:hypothetical protein OIE13_28920 [Streptosporangium sp. NBC_01810]|uniref:hypothetical protein n=1 Tax=Streptosporangium sp. NBC_01810 TaxID=2975951 RepID=UPI002DD946FD|nr:hypothetical protein [Streptosporangium sp. NBC_01810]WSA24921.1 hypothetical protein OIE13_28920 [Streptosporangium sp. NBC_01810]